LEFISHEGVLTASNGPSTGFISSDIGIVESGSTKEGTSLQLAGLGCLSGDFTWGVGKASPGQINIGQEIVCPEHPSSGELSTQEYDIFLQKDFSPQIRKLSYLGNQQDSIHDSVAKRT